jgi:hypothetical protein
MVTNNQIIESDGKRYRVQLVEVVTPTYEMAWEAGFRMNSKDMASVRAYYKLKTLEQFYNGGEEGKYGIYFAGDFSVFGSKDIFNFKDFATAERFIKEQIELLSIFYQL